MDGEKFSYAAVELSRLPVQLTTIRGDSHRPLAGAIVCHHHVFALHIEDSTA